MTEELKPHQIAQLVNKLRDIATKYHAHGCLRELISREVNAALTQRPAAQESITSAHITWDSQGRRLLNGRLDELVPQQATPEPVGEVVYIAKGHLREVLNGNTMNAYLSPEPDRFADVALFTRPAPGVPGDSELLDYLDTLATRAAGSDLHCFGGRVVLYVRTGIGSQIEASGAGTAREAIRAALAAAQAKGAGHE